MYYSSCEFLKYILNENQVINKVCISYYNDEDKNGHALEDTKIPFIIKNLSIVFFSSKNIDLKFLEKINILECLSIEYTYKIYMKDIKLNNNIKICYV